MNGVIYARFSSHNQREESIDAQVRACEEYAQRNEINIVKVYKDEAISGTSDRRPAFQAMIKDAESKSKMFDVILVHKLDRFARDKYDSAIYKRRIKNAKIKLISVTENLDGSPESIILESLLEGMAQYYSANLSREVMKGLSENALKCKHTGGKPPFGYDVDSNNCYVINEHEAIAVREAYKRYANGESYTSILKFLSDGGYRTKYNNPFQKTSLFSLFHNEKYKGTYVYNQFQRIKENGILRDVQHEEADIIRIENGVPAIVDTETWNAVQKKMIENKNNSRSFRATEKYLLAGKLYCGKCMKKMTGDSKTSHGGKSKFVGYRCAGQKAKTCDQSIMKRDTLDSSLIDFLAHKVFIDEVIQVLSDQVYKQYADSISEAINNVPALEAKLKDTERKIKNNMQAIEDGLYTPTIKTRLQELEIEKIEISRLIHEEKQKKKNSFTLEQIKEFISQGKNIEIMTFDQQKKIIGMFIDRVILYDKNFKVDFFINIELNAGINTTVTLDLSDVSVITGDGGS